MVKVIVIDWFPENLDFFKKKKKFLINLQVLYDIIKEEKNNFYKNLKIILILERRY